VGDRKATAKKTSISALPPAAAPLTPSLSGEKLVFALYVNNVSLRDLDNKMVAVGKDLGKIAEVIYLTQ
jgi:hypothetical protein